MAVINITTLILLGSLFALVITDCPNGYLRHDNSCYKLYTSVPSAWAAAMSICEIFGGHLAYIESEAEQLFVEGYLKREFTRGMTDGVWLGATDGLVEGEWLWVGTGNKITNDSYSKWWPGEPNSLGRIGEDCLDVLHHESYNWNDENCAKKIDFLCEMDLEINQGNQIIGK